jgi:hypothetical protein
MKLYRMINFWFQILIEVEVETDMYLFLDKKGN